jgi:signal transduction histidine kinase/PAS domain-containing protein
MLTQMSADSLDTLLLHIVDDMTLYSFLLTEGYVSEEITKQAVGFDEISVFHQTIYQLDTSGKLVGSTNSSQPSITWNQIPAVQSALNGNETNLSAWPQYSPGTLVIATPLRNLSGGTSGALIALLNLSDFHIFPEVTHFDISQTDVIDIVDPEGRVVFSNQEERLLKDNTEDLILTHLFQYHEGGVETCIGCPGTTPDELSDEVVAFAPLDSVPLGVVIRQPAQEVFSSVRRLVVWHTSLGFITIVGALGLVWATTNSVIDPLKTLNDAAIRIAGGDLDTPTEPFESWPSNRPRNDEIGTLGRSFNSMRLRLKDSISEVQTLNRELDARVQERTTQAISAQKEAQAARDDLQTTIDALSDELVVFNVDDRRIVQANQACREKNKDLGDVTRLKCFELFHFGQPCDTPTSICPLEDVRSSSKPVRVTHVRNKPGEIEPSFLDIIASPLHDSQGEVIKIVELVRDVTEEHQLRESLVRRNQQLATLNAVASTVNKSFNIHEILKRALDEVIERTPVEIGAVFLEEEVLGELNLMAYSGISEEAAQIISRFGMPDGSCGGVMEHGQLVIIPDISGFRSKHSDTLLDDELTTMVHIPLNTKGATLGSMCLGTRHYKEYGENENKMFLAIGKQIAGAIENAKLYSELEQKEQMRKELFRKAINAQEDERKRIARELHDDTSQALTALIFAAEEGLEIDDQMEVRACLERILKLTRQTLDGVHKLLFDLRPSVLDHLGLMPAIRWFAKSRLEPKGIRVNIQEEDHSCRLIPEAEIALFRVVQEAIINIARHSGARNVRISCGLTSERANIDIRDDGIGFDPSSLRPPLEKGHGFGLIGMSERLELVGGDFEITSIPGEGTCIGIHVPLGGNGRRETLA